MIKAMFQKWANYRYPMGREVLLEGRRIFILPSKQGMAFILMLIIILVAGINYQNNLAYGLCFTLGSVMFLSMIHTWRNLIGVALINTGAEPIFAGEMASFRIRLEVKGKGAVHQSIGIRWKDDEQSLQLADVSILEGAEILLSKRAPKRGIFSPGRIRIETLFPLGLFIAWTEADLLLNVVVYPAPIEGELSTQGKAGEEEEGIQSFGRGVDDFQGLRAYQAGDSMRLLNWKSFSKGQGLFVKDFTALAGKDPWLDFEAVSGNVEHRLSVLCYWVLQLSQMQRAFGFRIPTVELQPAIGEQHKNAALRALAMHGVSR